jgi:hypothetical protein
VQQKNLNRKSTVGKVWQKNNIRKSAIEKSQQNNRGSGFATVKLWQ